MDSELLRRIRLFVDVPDQSLSVVGKGIRWRRYAPQEEIISQDETSTDVYCIAEGRVRVTSFSPRGQEVSFRDLNAGETFGEISAIDGAPRSASVVALEATTLGAMPAELFRDCLRTQPTIAMATLLQLTFLVRELSERIFNSSTLIARIRVQAELLRLAREHSEDGISAEVRPAPTHLEIANRIGTQRETVSRELSSLARSGLVLKGRGSLIVPKIEALAAKVESARFDDI
ncbi:MAG: Crp/Fnr family transcriptional regulator [Geminicoccaceae bacterium]